MKYIFTTLILVNFAYANYTLYFSGIKLGELKSFDTLQENYIQAEVTNSIARFLLRKDHFIFYNDKFSKEKNKEQVKYKKDKNHIITILKKAVNNDLKTPQIIQINKDKYINIVFDKVYKFQYFRSGKIKSKGEFEIEDNILLRFEEERNSIKILKN